MEKNGKKTEKNGRNGKKTRKKRKKQKKTGKKEKIGSDTVPATPFAKPRPFPSPGRKKESETSTKEEDKISAQQPVGLVLWLAPGMFPFVKERGRLGSSDKEGPWRGGKVGSKDLL